MAVCFAGCNASDTPETTTQATEDSTREALCPICNVTVIWMGLTQAYVDTMEENWFAIDTSETAKFYRVEVYDETNGVIVAIGNPIWNR